MNRTLYLVQCCSSSTQNILAKLKQIYSDHDHVVFLGESVATLNQADLAPFSQRYCLETEQVLLNPDLVSTLTLLNYAQFADLVLQFERCISLK
ncbi:hypothetical protein D7V21_03395 [Acinetobacter guerrae]|uniref:DsrH like protein n=1 Tax=Acinetobacter guerrae TaxID=1843371 RepID=A0A3A8EPD4_9GAMM|nr:hypothetical protein [Acinetobacter guerrae]MPW42887.1 hypothetical protein [Acinetobacter guerrae]RKG35356.1 hypothetical protein D7V21_03395 [Acinetobacter guerrae]